METDERNIAMNNLLGVYAAKIRDSHKRALSRSGGLFIGLSDRILSEGGVIYGCVLDDAFRAVHVRADDIDLRNKMCGSKYTQSEMRSCFKRVREDLDTGKKVLFSGTSCQVSGLKSYLGKDDENLICVDIICHGVPSPLIWEKYLEWQEVRNGKCVEAVFRDKSKFGWRAHRETLTVKQRSGRIKAVSSSVYANLFYSHEFLRPCCYKCPYKSIYHPGDLTIGDCWGKQSFAPEFDDNKGISLVLVNSERGLKIFNDIKASLQYQEAKIEDCMQPPLTAPVPQPEDREEAWDYFYHNRFAEVAKRYGDWGVQNRVKEMTRRILRRLRRLIAKGVGRI